jgi:hypothetical protein
MDTPQIIAALIAERDRLNQAIMLLQGPTKRRGRPPKNQLTVGMAASAPPAPSANGRRGGMTAASRKAQSERMKAYWAKKRKAADKKN